MINAADLIKLRHHIVIVQRDMLVQQDMPQNGVHHLVVFQPNILMHVLHHLASTEDLPAVAETFTDNRTTHTSIMTEWTSHRRERFEDYQSPKYSTAAGTDHYVDDRQGQRHDTMASHNSSLHRHSPSPHHRRVTFDDYQDHHYRPQQHSLNHQSGSYDVYPDRRSYRQGNFRQLMRRGTHQLFHHQPQVTPNR